MKTDGDHFPQTIIVLSRWCNTLFPTWQPWRGSAECVSAFLSPSVLQVEGGVFRSAREFIRSSPPWQRLATHWSWHGTQFNALLPPTINHGMGERTGIDTLVTVKHWQEFLAHVERGRRCQEVRPALTCTGSSCMYSQLATHRSASV